MEISEEEKKELIKQQLSPFVELQAKAVQMYYSFIIVNKIQIEKTGRILDSN